MTTAYDFARGVNPEHCAPLPINPSYELPALTGEQLCQWAKNTGDLYARHLALAKAEAHLKTWRAHVDHILVPRYRREIEAIKMSCEARDMAARCLMAYYWRHWMETERLAGVRCFPCRHGYQSKHNERKG